MPGWFITIGIGIGLIGLLILTFAPDPPRGRRWHPITPIGGWTALVGFSLLSVGVIWLSGWCISKLWFGTGGCP